MLAMNEENLPAFQVLRRVKLGSHHHASLTKHTIRDKNGERSFPAFVTLEISSYPGEGSCYLFHICGDEQVADTWHQTLDEAFDQAEWEFGVRQDEWTVVTEPAIQSRCIYLVAGACNAPNAPVVPFRINVRRVA